MKKIAIGFLLIIAGFFAYKKFQKPSNKVEFTEGILNTNMVDINGNSTQLKYVLSEQKGKITLVDIWASWCGDCIKSLPRLEAFKKEHKDLEYLYLSVDKKSNPWQKTIDNHQIKGRHFRVKSGWNKKEDFSTFLTLDWIPRYLLIDKEGNIAYFYAKSIEDEGLIEKIKELSSL